MLNLVIDIGGTNTRVAKTTDNQSFGEPIIFNTPQGFELWLAVLKEHVRTLVQDEPIKQIIAGIPGTLSDDKGTIAHNPHLKPWEGIHVRDILSKSFSCEVHLENDAALVGLGEAVFGSGKGYSIVAYITISTGVGGVRITDGHIDKSAHGFEIGHEIVNDGKELEYYLAGSSHEKRFGMPSKDIKDPLFWKEVNYYTGVLAANITMSWSPHAIVFGGPVMNDINLEEATEHAKKLLTMYDELPVFIRSSLKNVGGLYGGLAYLQTIEK
jgi:predicted NBD/HSP70 family sugar kinase